ncbi:hypothetical protein FRX31_009480 [Thalictrum thalictroides]|uniref:Uncharacterized protein n=1 Tax=Thalictrum thalictroides TaxID=46969 RepID=A0A7J6WWM6_THATH|nr:hypothetical protein FRX31_009480 [Thalictrum thalictroides]
MAKNMSICSDKDEQLVLGNRDSSKCSQCAQKRSALYSNATPKLPATNAQPCQNHNNNHFCQN